MNRGKISRRESGRPLVVYSPSAAASVDITSILTSVYPRYRIDIDLLPVDDDVQLLVRTDNNNGASFDATLYRFASRTENDGAGSTTENGASVTSIAIGEGNATAAVGNASNEGIAGTIFVERLGTASLHPLIRFDVVYVSAAGLATRVSGGASHAAVGPIDAVQLLFESGNIASGTVRVYGIPAL